MKHKINSGFLQVRSQTASSIDDLSTKINSEIQSQALKDSSYEG